jgi:hypothetical protein
MLELALSVSNFLANLNSFVHENTDLLLLLFPSAMLLMTALSHVEIWFLII